MLVIGQLYFDHYIRACTKLQFVCIVFTILESSSIVRMNKGRTPVFSNDVSRPSCDTRKAMIMAMGVEAPQNHQQAKSNVSATDHVISSEYIYILPHFQGHGLEWISLHYNRPIVRY